MSRRLPLLVAALIAASACSTEGVNTITNRGLDYRPIVDMKGVDHIAYQTDLMECKAYAAQIKGGESALAGALIGAAAGAAIGAAVGAPYGQAGYGAATGATAGGFGGGARGAVSATLSQEQVVRRCLMGRGYNVLY